MTKLYLLCIAIGIGMFSRCTSTTSPDEGFQFNNLVWSDEFEGTSLDLTKWSHQTGNGTAFYPHQAGWGNQELQIFEVDNTTIANGELCITAKYENAQYTSSRIVTKDRFEFTYGRIEARIRLPYGDEGLWPCFWLMGANVDDIGWPSCGEVDIMEMGGKAPDEVHCTVHYGYSYQTHAYKSETVVLGDRDYHIYTLEWDSEQIKGFMDGVHYFTFYIGNNPPFHEDFYITLNVSVGGSYSYSGYPVVSNYMGDGMSMNVDWVRIYQ